jgi:hypothetical protein
VLITIQKKLPSTIALTKLLELTVVAAFKPVEAIAEKIPLATNDHIGHKIMDKSRQVSMDTKPVPSELLKVRFTV